jgi:hypothetical protein
MRKNEKMSEETRTKIRIAVTAAHQKAKKNGEKLGSARPGHWKGRRRGFREAAEASGAARSRRTRECYKVVIELITKWQAEGLPYGAIATRLNDQGYLTMGSNPFTAPAVCAVLKIFGRKPVKHPAAWDTCIKCEEKFRIPKKELKDRCRPHVCFNCREEA